MARTTKTTVSALRIEQELATVSRALYRAQEIADRTAMYAVGDLLRLTAALTATTRDHARHGWECVTLPHDVCAYLYSVEHLDSGTATRQPVRSSESPVLAKRH